MGTITAGGTRTEREGMITCLVSDARAVTVRGATREILRLFKENDILTYASAISFQVFFALVPMALLALGLLSAFGATGVFTHDIAPTLKQNLSGPVYHAVDDTVRKVLADQHLFWITLGAAIAVWEVSGAMRATMQVLNRVYGTPEERTFRRKLWESIALSTVVTLLLLLAAGSVKAGPGTAKALFGEGALVSVLSFLASWGIAVGLLFAVVMLVVR